MKILVYGLDGASFSLINKFVNKGVLPNFKKVIEQGIFQKLKSTIPPHTAPGWVSAFTGVGPGKHGVYQFFETQAKNYMGRFMGRDDFGVLPVWDILNQCDLKTGMINIPMTYPPKKVNGFIVGWPISNTIRYAYPNEILYEISRQGGHVASDINCMYNGNLDYIYKALDITQKRLKTLEYVMNHYEWDFLVSVFTEIDRVSHFYWHYMDNTSREYIETEDDNLKTAIEQIYFETDKVLGRILELLPEDALLMILSDHGFDKGEINFYVQSYLIEHSLLSIKKSPNLDSVNDKGKDTSDVVTNSWLECFYKDEKYTIDWKKTVAYMSAPGSYGINVNRKGRQQYGSVESNSYEAVRDTLIKVFLEARHPHHGSKLFKKVARREEVYKGDKVDQAPDIILIPKDYSTMVHHNIIPGVIFGSPEHKGMHDRNGILGLYGKEIKGKRVPFDAVLEDITPTILNYFGIDVPDYMDGKPMIDFERNSGLKAQYNSMTGMGNKESSEKQDSYTEAERSEIENKLKSMGYL